MYYKAQAFKPVASSSKAEDYGSVLALAGGGWMVAFTDTTAGSNNVWLASVDSGGSLTAPDTPNDFTGNKMANVEQGREQVVCQLLDGSLVVAWLHYNGTDNDVMVRHLSASGEVLASGNLKDPTVINTVTNGWQTLPHLTALANGGFVASWETLGNADIAFRSFDADLAPVSAAENAVGTASQTTRNLVPIALDNGAWAGIWSTNTTGNIADSKIVMQAYSASDDLVGPQVELINGGASYAVIRLFDERIALAWYDAQLQAHFTLFGKDGTKGATGQINTTQDGKPNSLELAALPDGGFVAVWQGKGTDAATGMSDTTGIFLQVFKADGTRLGGETLVNVITDKNQTDPDVAVDANGDILVTLNCPPFRPDSRHKQKGSSTGLRIGLCPTSIDALN